MRVVRRVSDFAHRGDVFAELAGAPRRGETSERRRGDSARCEETSEGRAGDGRRLRASSGASAREGPRERGELSVRVRCRSSVRWVGRILFRRSDGCRSRAPRERDGVARVLDRTNQNFALSASLAEDRIGIGGDCASNKISERASRKRFILCAFSRMGISGDRRVKRSSFCAERAQRDLHRQILSSGGDAV